MRNKTLILFLSLSIVLFYCVACFAENPDIQTNFTADPAPMVYQT